MHAGEELRGPRPPQGVPTRHPIASTARRIAASTALLALWGAVGTAAAQASPRPVAELRRHAERLRSEQRLPEALAAYRALVAREPAGFEDRFWVAKLEGWTGAPDAAERDLVALLSERPEDYDTRIALADVRRWRGDIAGAGIVLEDLRRSHPDDAEVTGRLASLRSPPSAARWEADLEYEGERWSGGGAGDGATLALRTLMPSRVRWRGALTVQDKFDRTETRGGSDLGVRLSESLELTGAAFLSPGAEVLPRGTWGLGLTGSAARGLVLGADYRHDAYADARVHGVGPTLEWYTGRWLLAARYRYIATGFEGVSSTAGDHTVLVSTGYQYGAANIVRLFGFAGAQSFGQPSRDRIGVSDTRGAGIAWRHFVSSAFGLEAAYALEDRSGGTTRHTYGLRLVRRW